MFEDSHPSTGVGEGEKVLELQEEVGELTQAYLTVTGRTRRPADDAARKQLALEMADALGMLLIMARAEGIDMDQAMQDKCRYVGRFG